MDKNRRIAIGSAIIMLLMVALTGLPYFSYDGGSVSISSYVWFPYEHAEFETYLAGQFEGYEINSVIGTPIFLQVSGVIGAALLIWLNGKRFAPLVPLCYGAIGTVGYLTSGFLRLGSAWGLHLALLVILVGLGALGLYWQLREARNERAALVRDEQVTA